ncbi:MAG: sigma-54-dependent Fis family transcriptional regulator, partial [Sphingomonas sp.]
AVECAAALAPRSATGVDVGAADLAFAVGDAVADLPTVGTPQTLEEEIAALEYRRITEALVLTGHNHTHTARNLGLSRVGLLKKLDRMGLR